MIGYDEIPGCFLGSSVTSTESVFVSGCSELWIRGPEQFASKNQPIQLQECQTLVKFRRLTAKVSRCLIPLRKSAEEGSGIPKAPEEMGFQSLLIFILYGFPVSIFHWMGCEHVYFSVPLSFILSLQKQESCSTVRLIMIVKTDDEAQPAIRLANQTKIVLMCTCGKNFVMRSE